MIREEEVFLIGRITRTHGTRGELELNFTDTPFDNDEASYLVLELDGILVPFFFTEWRYKGNENALFTFEDIETEEKARRFVGARVYFPFSEMADGDDDAELSSIKALTGFTVEGIGRITDVDDSSANILLTIATDDGSEILIPYHDDFLVDYDLRKRTLTLDLPEGLMDLN